MTMKRLEKTDSLRYVTYIFCFVSERKTRWRKKKKKLDSFVEKHEGTYMLHLLFAKIFKKRHMFDTLADFSQPNKQRHYTSSPTRRDDLLLEKFLVLSTLDHYLLRESFPVTIRSVCMYVGTDIPTQVPSSEHKLYY